MPRVRFTVRRLMIAVAIVAMLLGVGGWLRGRREQFRRVARRHQVRLALLDAAREPIPFPDHENVVPGHPAPVSVVAVAPSDPASEWHRLMATKYARAARYPWLPVAPDPPEPE